MAQTFHKFKAESLDQAYKAMRKKLGDEAIVVRTATVTEGGLLGFMARKMVELTASSSEKRDGGPRRRSPAEKKYLTAGRAPLSSRTEASTDPDKVAHYKRLIRDAQRRMTDEPAPPLSVSPARREAVPATAPASPLRTQTAVKQRHEPAAAATAVRDEIREMRKMLSLLTAEMPGSGLPEDYLPVYRALLDRGLDRAAAASLVSTASKGLDKTQNDLRLFRERLKMEVRRSLSATGGIALVAGECRVVALVGPTGVGKTTNIAKLAANFAVQEHAKVGVITADTYRIAATDQLRVYANIIDLEMKIANDAKEMTDGIKAFRDHDLVLIDTAGGSPYNQDQMSDIEKILVTAHPDEVMLVLSASTPLEDLRGIVTQFSRLKPSSLLFTKLDETRRCGPMYCLAAEAALPMSYFSIGQNVPDDLVLAKAGTIANMVVEGGNQSGRSGTEAS